MRVVIFNGRAVDVGDVDQGAVCHRHHAFAGVAVYGPERAYLVHVHPGEAREFAQHACGSVVDAFLAAYEAAHERPFAGFGLEIALSQQKAQAAVVKAEYNAVDGHVESVVSCIVSAHCILERVERPG